jgi:hypothetical protein
MIAEAIDKIISLAAPNMIFGAPGEKTYSDKKLYDVKTAAAADALIVRNLDGFCEYIRKFAQNDAESIGDYFVLVESYKKVSFISRLNRDRDRETLIMAVPDVPDFPFGRFIENEKMIILLQSAFVEDPETDLNVVRKFVGTVSAGTVKEYSDDGVSQQATVRQGPKGRVDDVVPSPCTLRPYRTFVEVDQPVSRFIFRMEQGREQTVSSALIEADGGAWKLKAIQNIIDHLEYALADTGVKVIG